MLRAITDEITYNKGGFYNSKKIVYIDAETTSIRDQFLSFQSPGSPASSFEKEPSDDLEQEHKEERGEEAQQNC